MDMPELTISLPQLKSAELLELIIASPLPGLGDGPQYSELATWLHENWRQQSSLANAGLWLLAGNLDESHQISQSIESPEGSFWHGIMHRREGDFWNAKYWFRRVGRHPVLSELAKHDYGAPILSWTAAKRPLENQRLRRSYKRLSGKNGNCYSLTVWTRSFWTATVGALDGQVVRTKGFSARLRSGLGSHYNQGHLLRPPVEFPPCYLTAQH